jgi:flagellar biosynthesis/type III secretory pathway protein FliH
MTLSYEPKTAGRTTASGSGLGRAARVLRGRAVEHAQPATLHVEHGGSSVAAKPKHQTPAERVDAARAEGYEDGYRAGLEAARVSREAARQEALRKGADALHQAAAAIEAGRANAVAVVEEDAATLAVELTRTLLDHELSQVDSTVSAAIRRALRLTAPGEDLVVRLHPDEVIEATELQAYVTDCRITVVPDESVEQGGCIIDSGPCRIDAQIESALGRVRWALLSATQPGDPSSFEPAPAPAQGPVGERGARSNRP